MDLTIYDKFSAYTNLPVLIDWVKEQVCEECAIDECLFIPVQMDQQVLLGMHRMFTRSEAGGVKRRVLHIYYSDALDQPQVESWRRMVCCKELLHVYDNEKQTAKSRVAVEKLIEGIVVPPSSGMSASLASDHNGMMLALVVLLPRDALDVLIPQFEAQQASVEDVAILSDIPEAYARLALSPVWKAMLERI